jgi:hypothetical protein
MNDKAERDGVVPPHPRHSFFRPPLSVLVLGTAVMATYSANSLLPKDETQALEFLKQNPKERFYLVVLLHNK